MKKIYFLLFAMAFSGSLFAQIPTDDMESWRSTTAGIGTPTTIEAPYKWYGSDSIIIALGQTVGSIVLSTDDSDWRRQIFKESAAAYVHGGASSAKIMTRNEGSYLIPGVISNAIPSVQITFTPPYISGISLKGGSPISAKPTSVSAWVQYYPGTGGIDSGSLTVQVLGQVGGKDSVIGTGFVIIGPSSSWVQVTANITYPLHTNVAVDTFRIALSSGKGQSGLDSSTLYADDLSMVTIPNPDHSGVNNVTANDLVRVYPNPANGTLYLDGPKNEAYTCNLFSVSGRTMITTTITGSGTLDVSSLPAGFYFYAVNDGNGNIIQRGKVVLSR